MLIAQISDIHATADSPVLVSLDRIVRWLAPLSIDALVITGDLISSGWVDGYDHLANQLKALSCPIFALPGNSDDAAAMRLSSLASNTNWLFASGPMHFTEFVGHTPIVGLDVTVAGKAHGDALPHVEWLRAELGNLDAPALIFMHQPPVLSGIDIMDAINCHHSTALAETLAQAKHPPLGIFCGHVHRTIFSYLGATPVGICGSLCPPNPLLFVERETPPVTDGPSMFIHEIRDRLLRTHTVAFPA